MIMMFIFGELCAYTVFHSLQNPTHFIALHKK